MPGTCLSRGAVISRLSEWSCKVTMACRWWRATDTSEEHCIQKVPRCRYAGVFYVFFIGIYISAALCLNYLL